MVISKLVLKGIFRALLKITRKNKKKQNISLFEAKLTLKDA